MKPVNNGIQPVYDLMQNPVDDRDSLGKKRYLDYFVPKPTEVRKTIYSDGAFEKIRTVKKVKLYCTAASAVITAVVGAVIYRAAEFGRWTLDYRAAMNGKPTDLFGKVPYDPSPHPSHFQCNDEGTGCRDASPLYKFQDKVQGQYFGHIFAYGSAILAVVTIVPAIFWGIEYLANRKRKEEIEGTLNQQALDLRNAIVTDKSMNSEKAESILGKKHDFKALYQFGESELLDSIYQYTLPHFRDKAKLQKRNLPTVTADRDIVDLTSLNISLTGYEIGGRRISYYDRDHNFSKRDLDVFIEALKENNIKLAKEENSKVLERSYLEAERLKNQREYAGRVIAKITEELEKRPSQRQKMTQLKGRIIDIRNKNRETKIETLDMFRKSIAQEILMQEAWELIHRKETRENLPEAHMKSMDALTRKIEEFQGAIDAEFKNAKALGKLQR